MTAKVIGLFMAGKTVFVKGIGNLPPNINLDVCKGIEMERISSGVMCYWKGKKFEIPAVQCLVIQYENDRAAVAGEADDKPAKPMGRQFQKQAPKEIEPPPNQVKEAAGDAAASKAK